MGSKSEPAQDQVFPGVQHCNECLMRSAHAVSPSTRPVYNLGSRLVDPWTPPSASLGPPGPWSTELTESWCAMSGCGTGAAVGGGLSSRSGKYLIYFPDLEVFEWRWASAFYVPSHPSCVARSCGELGPHPRGG